MKRSWLWVGRWLALVVMVAGLVAVLRPVQAGTNTNSPPRFYSSNPVRNSLFNLGAAPVGTPTRTDNLTISSIGADPLTISSITVIGANAADFSITPFTPPSIVLTTRQTQTVTITCTPSQTGQRTAELQVAHNGTNVDSPAVYSLRCGGFQPTTLTPGYGSTPAPGSTIAISAPVGGSASSTVVVSETGTANLVISDDEIAGSLALTATSSAALPTTIADGSGTTVTYTITCAPTTATPITGTLTITHNAPGSPAVYPVTCTVTDTPTPAPTPIPTIGPTPTPTPTLVRMTVPPPCPQAVIPAGSVVGRLSATAQIYYAPGQQSPGLFLPGGTAYWVLGLDSTGDYYQIILSCQRLWVEADLMGPNFEPPWFGAPLPTGTVQ